jgi:hypothetical protein
MAHKNDYSVIAKVSGPYRSREFMDFRKWTYVHDLLAFHKFLVKEYPRLQYYNVYDRRTGLKLKSFSRKNPPTERFI